MGLQERLYARSPVWMQDGLVSLRGLDFRLRRASTAIMREHYGFLCESQHWSAERFRAHQEGALRETLRRAFAEVPHYRELRASLGCDPEDFRTLDDLRRLPVLEKHQVRGQEERFLSDAFAGVRPYVNYTSGTTGTPMRTFETRRSFSLRMAFLARLRGWVGVGDPFYPRRAQFTGRNIVPDAAASAGRVFWRRNLAANALLFSTTHLSPETVPAYARALGRFEPEVVEGYPSAITVIARVALRLGLALPRPRGVITSAETLLPEQRRDIEAAFGCPVYDQYASSEPSCCWSNCEHGVMHQHPEYGVSEILDAAGQPVAPGEEGFVVVTSFLNPLMPLVRYRLGDLAVPGSAEPCACGRQMPRVERVLGRMDDTLYVPPRGYVGRLDPVFKGLSNLLEVQIVQEALDHVQVLMVPDAGFRPELEAILLRNLRDKLGEEVRIDLQRVERIPRGANGKFRSVVSRVRHLYPDAV